jgi:hypothetical protein
MTEYYNYFDKIDNFGMDCQAVAQRLKVLPHAGHPRLSPGTSHIGSTLLKSRER